MPGRLAGVVSWLKRCRSKSRLFSRLPHAASSSIAAIAVRL
jgi:hypothetical protein